MFELSCKINFGFTRGIIVFCRITLCFGRTMCLGIFTVERARGDVPVLDAGNSQGRYFRTRFDYEGYRRELGTRGGIKDLEVLKG